MVNPLRLSILKLQKNSPVILTYYWTDLLSSKNFQNLTEIPLRKLEGWRKFQRIFDGVVFANESSKVNSLILSIFTSLNSLFTCKAKFTIHLHFIHLCISSTVNISDIDKYH